MIMLLKNCYIKFYRFCWKVFAVISPVNATKRRFKLTLGRYPDLKNPKTLNEKMQFLKLYKYRNDPLVTKCTDKYLVREYVKQCGCEEILNDLYGVYDNANQIPWDELPQSFVLKCNHGSGGNIICRNKDDLDKNIAIRQLNSWLKEDFGLNHVEFSYEGIKRKIICEKLIETPNNLPPNDYKIFCSYGTPKLLFVACDRYEGNTKFDYYTPEWEWIPVKNGHPNAGPIDKPNKLDEMLSYASKLSAQFPIVRVDLYCENNAIIFGELTFLHFGGVTPFDPYDYDLKFGDMFPLKQ